MTDEIWKDIKGYEGLYEVSSHGQIRGYQKTGPGSSLLSRPTALNLIEDANGYMRVNLCKPGRKRRHAAVHRIVAETFLPNPDSKPCVNHRDSNRTNNHISNLEWCTHSENSRHANRRGRQKNVFGKGAEHPGAVLTEVDVRGIKRNYRAGGVTQRQLAKRYGTSQQQVQKIVNNKIWRHVS